jgi:hypothetical protein
MRIHLITYATPRFRLRQLILGWSARANGVVDTVTHWTPQKLLAAGFEDRCKDIKLSERGSGFWAWKPFIIDAKLREVPNGDLVFYCDVGRLYPFKLLDQPINPYLDWMNQVNQDIMPGVLVPWDGTNSHWIKRSALASMSMDHENVHNSTPIQASFSIWRSGIKSSQFVDYWLNTCAQRELISDDAADGNVNELPCFRGHRHDQALLNLCCISKKIKGLSVGLIKPSVDTKNPSEISRYHFSENREYPLLMGKLVRKISNIVSLFEKIIRKFVKFNHEINE